MLAFSGVNDSGFREPPTLGWGRGLEDTYGQNVTISPSVVFEPAGPPVRAAGDGDPGCSINHDRGAYSKRPAITERIMGPKDGWDCGT